ncbi:Uncharacterised protein [uncultured archaeon]|nr:Uncharacterised protein [uncultured archaeon]
MNSKIRPLGILLMNLAGRRTKIWETPFGKVKNKTLADESVDTCLRIIQAIQGKREYFEYRETSYMLPEKIPETLMVFLPFYLSEEEKKEFFEQEKTGNIEIRGTKFHYLPRQLSEQEKLEHEIEGYITEGTFIDVHNLDDGLPRILSTVRSHSRENNEEDLEFAQDLICSGQGRKQIRGKERLEIILKLSPKMGFTRGVNDPEIRPKYDRLMEIYSAQQTTQ